jgi:biotin carboxyl carrier protein
MAEEKIITEVAGRVCAIPAEPGAKIGAGQDVCSSRL